MYDVPVIPGAVQGGWIGLDGQNGPITEGGGEMSFIIIQLFSCYGLYSDGKLSRR